MRTIEQKLRHDDIIEASKCHPNKIKHIAGQIEVDHAHLLASNMQINIYIIGSLSQAKLIKKLAKQLKKENWHFNIKYAHKKKKSIETVIHDCFDKIKSSNHIVAVTKPDGSFGKGTSYEIEFAKRMGTPIYIVNPKDIKDSLEK